MTQVQTQDWRFAHPGATLVGSFRVKAVLDSPLVNNLIAQATAKDPSAGAMVGMMRKALGGVSEVRFSVRDMGKGKNPDVLALVTGVLDDASAGAITQGKAGVHRIDANTLLVGEGQSLEDAVARMSKPAAGLQARALDRSKALANNDLWIAGTLPELPMTLPVLDSLRSLALGISAQSDLRVELALEMASAETGGRSGQLGTPVAGTAAGLGRGAAERSGRLHRALPVRDGRKSGDPGSAAGYRQQRRPAVRCRLFWVNRWTFKSTAPEPAAPPDPKRDTIIIYGLEGGTARNQAAIAGTQPCRPVERVQPRGCG